MMVSEIGSYLLYLDMNKLVNNLFLFKSFYVDWNITLLSFMQSCPSMVS